MIEFIKENINWLKDLFTLFFVGTGTVVAILTYRRARATILQPIRTEVIKKQSENLSGLLQIIKDNNHSFEGGLDYYNIVEINVLLLLRDYGYIFKNQENILKKIESELSGWTPVGNSNFLKDLEIIGTFKNDLHPDEIKEFGVAKYDQLKEGEIDIDKIYLSNKYTDFRKLIMEYKEDPFMPSSISKILQELTNDIDNNISIVLKSELQIFMLNYSKSYLESIDAPSFNMAGVYNNFNHSRIHHRNTVEKLKKEIRNYLRIDEGW